MTKKLRLTNQQILDIPVVVPVSAVDNAEINDLWEKAQCLDLPLVIGDFRVRPPSLGVWTLLELINARAFVLDYYNMTELEYLRVLYLNEFRESASLDAMVWLTESLSDRESGETELDEKIASWARPYREELFRSEAIIQIYDWFAMSWNGWAMFPGSAISSEPDYFGAVRVAGAIATVGPAMNLSPKGILWDVPACLVGHTLAQVAIAQGNTKIARPIDQEDKRRKMIQAKLITASGNLLPWQKMSPLNRWLSKEQIKYGGDRIVREFKQAKQAALAGSAACRTPELQSEALAMVEEMRGEYNG